MPSAQLSVTDEKGSPRVTPFDAASCASAPLHSHQPDRKVSRWQLSAVSKQDLIQGILIVPPLAMVYIFGIVNHTGLEIVHDLASDTGFPYQGHRLRILTTCYYVALALFAVPSSMACALFGPRYWLPLVAIIGGIATLLLAFVHSFAGLIVLRVLTGAVFAGVLPSIATALLPFFGDTRFVFPLAVVVSGGPGLATLGAPIAERIFSDVHAIGRAQGWQAIFLVEGILTMGAGTIAFAIMPNSLFHSAVTTKHTAALYHSQLGQTGRPTTFKTFCTRHGLICGLVMTAVIAVLAEKLAQLTPLKHTISPATGPTFSSIHLWDFLPDTVASLSTIFCALVIYRRPLWLYPATLTTGALSALGAVVFLVSDSTNQSGGEYSARVLSTSATQCQLPLIFAILVQKRVRKAAGECRLACILAITNVGYGIGGVVGVWQAQLPRAASAFLVLICAVCSFVLLSALTVIDRRSTSDRVQPVV